MKVDNQVAIKTAIQTLDFYRQREYKGLEIGNRTEVAIVKKGKIGIA